MAIELELKSITLDEAAEVELAADRDFQQLIRTNVNRRRVVLYILALRAYRSGNSANAPSWQGLSDRLLLDSFRSTSPESPDGLPSPSAD